MRTTWVSYFVAPFVLRFVFYFVVQSVVLYFALNSLPARAFDPYSLFGGEEQTPPEVKPFKLPSLTGEAVDFHGYLPPLVAAPRLDADGIFEQAVNCFPEASKFKVEVTLEGGLRSQDILTADNTHIGKSYAGIVARMPLYSPWPRTGSGSGNICAAQPLLS